MPVIKVDAGAVPYFSMIVVPGRDRRLDSAGRSVVLRPALSADPVDGPRVFVVGLGPGGDGWTTRRYRRCWPRWIMSWATGHISTGFPPDRISDGMLPETPSKWNGPDALLILRWPANGWP